MLTKKGIMSQKLANYFFRDLKDEDRSKMLEAAQLLDIVSRHPKTEQDVEYFVPSALREDYEAKIEVKSSSNDIPSPAPLVLRPDSVGMFIEYVIVLSSLESMCSSVFEQAFIIS